MSLQIREPKTPTDGLLNNVLLAIEQRKDPAYQAIGAYELAPGVVAVEDSLGETDIYYDISMWDLAHPKAWLPDDGSSCLYRNTDTGTGVLPGVSRFPPVKSPSMALEFAQDQLTAVSAQWLPAPKMLR